MWNLGKMIGLIQVCSVVYACGTIAHAALFVDFNTIWVCCGNNCSARSPSAPLGCINRRGSVSRPFRMFNIADLVGTVADDRWFATFW